MRVHVLLLTLLLGWAAQAAPPDYEILGDLLEEIVHWNDERTASEVDYALLAKRREHLKQALEEMAAVTRGNWETWPGPDRLAFLINVYNAWTLELILRGYPELDSIKDLGGLFRSPWDIELVRLWGDEVSLDDVEHRLIRELFEEPRIHFAVNCASCGCPALAEEPYAGERLDQQLDRATERFLRDRERNRVALQSERVVVSPIFDWYEEDFEVVGGVRAFLRDRAEALADTPEERNLLSQERFRLRHGDYDWTLNDLDRVSLIGHWPLAVAGQ